MPSGELKDNRGGTWVFVIDPEEPEVVRIKPSWMRRGNGIPFDVTRLQAKLWSLQNLATIEYGENA